MKLFLSISISLASTTSALAVPVERSQISIIDGDTIWVGTEKVRLVGFDTPEPEPYNARCDEEIDRGKKASARLAELLATGAIDIRYRKHRDRYGRMLGRLTVDGVNVGKALIRDGHAIKYAGYGPKMDWCPRYRRR